MKNLPSRQDASVTTSKTFSSGKFSNRHRVLQSEIPSQRLKSTKYAIPPHVVEDIRDIFSYLTALHEYTWHLSNYCLVELSKASIFDIAIKDFYDEQANFLCQGCVDAINACADFVVLYDKIGYENYLISKHFSQNPKMYSLRPFWQVSRFALARINFLLLVSLSALGFSIALPFATLIGDLLFYTACYALIEKSLLYARVVWLEFNSSNKNARKKLHSRDFSKQVLFCQSRALGSPTDLAYLFFPVYVFAFMYTIGIAAPLSAFLAASLNARRLIPLVWVILHSIQSLATPGIASYDGVQKTISNLFVTNKPSLQMLSSPNNMTDTLKQTICRLAKENALINHYWDLIKNNYTHDLAQVTSSKVSYLQAIMEQKSGKQLMPEGNTSIDKANPVISKTTVEEEGPRFSHQGLFAQELRKKAFMISLEADGITISESFFCYMFQLYPAELSVALLHDMPSTKVS